MLLAVNYHYIRNSFEADFPAIFGISPEKFEEQLLELSKYGEFVSARQIADSFQNGTALPDRAIIITFDDGLKEQYNLAVPILRKLNIPAIFFINTKTLTDPFLLNVHLIHIVRSLVSPAIILQQMMQTKQLKSLSKGELDKMRQNGIDHYIYDNEENAYLKYLLNFVLSADELRSEFEILLQKYASKSIEEIALELYMNKSEVAELAKEEWIGSHSHYHAPIGTLKEEEAERQIKKSKEILNDVCAYQPYAFSYPYGSDEAVGNTHKLLEKYGFSFSFTMKRKVNLDYSDPLRLHRFDNNDVVGGKSFKPDLLNSFLNV